jgi:hypothetical protein
MDERSKVLTATFVGAAIGGFWGWLYLTGNGGRVRARIGPTFDRFIDDLAQVRATGEKAKTAIDDGRQLVTDIKALRESA